MSRWLRVIRGMLGTGLTFAMGVGEETRRLGDGIVEDSGAVSHHN